jgi:hypothetical protein
MRMTPDLDAARRDLAELGGYLLVLTPQNRSFLDKQGAAIERRWRDKEVFVVCDRNGAAAAQGSREQLDAMDAIKMRDESKLSHRDEEDKQGA